METAVNALGDNHGGSGLQILAEKFDIRQINGDTALRHLPFNGIALAVYPNSAACLAAEFVDGIGVVQNISMIAVHFKIKGT